MRVFPKLLSEGKSDTKINIVKKFFRLIVFYNVFTKVPGRFSDQMQVIFYIKVFPEKKLTKYMGKIFAESKVGSIFT